MFYNYTLYFGVIVLVFGARLAFASSMTDNYPHDNNKYRKEADTRSTTKYDDLEEDYLFLVKNRKGDSRVGGRLKKDYSLQQVHCSGIKWEKVNLHYPEEKSNLLYDSFNKKEKDECWKLTKRQLQEKKLEAGFYLATATAELLDSIYMPYFSRGLFNIIGTGYKIKKYEKEIKEKYGIHIELSGDEAVLIYEEKF